MNEAAGEYLEKSFLGPLLAEKGLTDVSYNGDAIFYALNDGGRKRSSLMVSRSEVGALLRQIANLTERQFSYQSPILDVSFSRYRLNAVFTSLTRSRNEKTYSFSIRLASESSLLEGDAAFFGGAETIILEALRHNESLVIGGQTSSGKTELEKWCLTHLADNKRVIVIDSVEELDMISNPAIDLTTWLVNPDLPEATFGALIRNALRNNPDYIIVSEARGAEMLDGILSALSGHPIITTVHCESLLQMPERMARLAMLGDKRLEEKELLSDIRRRFRCFVFLQKNLSAEGKIERFVSSIGRPRPPNGEMEILYERKNT